MARNELNKRVDALERALAPFVGYASVEVWPGQSVEDAKAAWQAENGAIGARQVVLWNFGGLSCAA